MAARDDYPTKNPRVHRVGIYASVLLAVFLVGFLPMWLTARGRALDLDEARQALRLARIENSLAAAALEARRGEYEAAREAASAFYTALQSELERPDADGLAAARDALQPILSERDEMITLLARADAAAADRLADAYVGYRSATAPLRTSPTTSPGS